MRESYFCITKGNITIFSLEENSWIFLPAYTHAYIHTHLLRNAEDSDLGVLHLEDGVLDHELTAQVTVVAGAHGVHLLTERIDGVEVGAKQGDEERYYRCSKLNGEISLVYTCVSC